MGERTEISWCHHTFNPWVGCTKVSAACDHCYAESWAKRSGHPELWQGERRRTSASNWQQPHRWNRAAGLAGERRRVFCASLADVFDNQVWSRWQDDLWHLIAQTPHLDWLLLTKRPQNITKMLPGPIIGAPGWGNGWPNVWLGTTVENQEEADRRVPSLLAVPAVIRFLSCEPLLGSIDLPQAVCQWAKEELRRRIIEEAPPASGHLDWVICGGESGPGHRPMDLNWARDLRDQCAVAGIAFHFKQHGGARPTSGGCLLDGREWKEFPVAA